MKRYVEVLGHTSVLNEDTVGVTAFFYIIEDAEFGPEYKSVNTMTWIIPRPTMGDLESIMIEIADHTKELENRIARGII